MQASPQWYIPHSPVIIVLRERLNCLITGATGVGKSYIACALAHQACRAGYRVRYLRLPRLRFGAGRTLKETPRTSHACRSRGWVGDSQSVPERPKH